MCDCQRTRRELLAGALALGLSACAASTLPQLPDVARQAAVEVAPGVRIHPRADWDGGEARYQPKRAMAAEDVRFLLVHHTASSNHVPDPRVVIRQTFAYQTSASKGWPDICYHFMIGPDGSIWETRAGSLAGPVVADASGGNQGYAQLVCLLGDFTSQAPTAAAQDSLMRMLLWLADRYGIDTDPAATVTFTSRGSDKFRRGTSITTPTISGHRDVTYTACPGNLGYTLLGGWRSRVHATRLMRNDPGPIKRAVRLGVHLT
ncbi:MAG: peptidoglycan recognition family protein [Ilumatobacteraceae bacterium]